MSIELLTCSQRKHLCLSQCSFLCLLSSSTFLSSQIQLISLSFPAGSFDHFLNLQIALVIAMQLTMCGFCAVANYVWIQKAGKSHYYLALTSYTEGNWSNPVEQIVLTFLTFWILLSYLVPISLFVTLPPPRPPCIVCRG